jgi:hypothetical protein
MGRQADIITTITSSDWRNAIISTRDISGKFRQYSGV